MSQIAASFLRRCFAPEETIAVLLRRQDAAAPMQRVVGLDQALESRYMAWLSYENQHGRSNIYVAANPLRPGSRKRTKECIASVRHLYIDIDTDGNGRLAVLRASDMRVRFGEHELSHGREYPQNLNLHIRGDAVRGHACNQSFSHPGKNGIRSFAAHRLA